jgi:hypothetical protein
MKKKDAKPSCSKLHPDCPDATHMSEKTLNAIAGNARALYYPAGVVQRMKMKDLHVDAPSSAKALMKMVSAVGRVGKEIEWKRPSIGELLSNNTGG